jgi:hypothetical protein
VTHTVCGPIRPAAAASANSRSANPPHLAAALADQPAEGDPAQPEPLFDRAMTRILTGLLPPVRTATDRPADWAVNAGAPSLQ